MTGHLDRLDAACRHPARVIITDGAGDWTGTRLGDGIDRWRALLDRLGPRRIGGQLPNGATWVALDIAVLISGRIAVPIPDFFTADQTRHVIGAAGIDTCIGLTGTLPAGFEPVATLDGIAVGVRHVDPVPPLHAGTAKITFTSGSTGTPKGVCLSAGHLLQTAATIRDAFAHSGITRHLCALPLALLLENVAGVYASLLNGSHLDLPPLSALGLAGSSQLDVDAFVRAQHHFRPESLILVPQLLLALLGAAHAGAPLPDAYRLIAVGGARVAPHLLDAAAALGLPVFEGYGLSECGSVVALNRPGDARPGSVGKPLAHAGISIRDGEIHVSRSVMLGYLGEAPAPTVLATGDLGHFDAQGYLCIDGRRRNCFISAFGRNVNPEWVESELTAQPEIALAAVFGEALPGNVAVIVPRTTETDRIEAAVRLANRRLPDYARVGTWITVAPSVFREHGCVTASGKIALVMADELEAATRQLQAAVSPQAVPTSPEPQHVP